jgi:two-component system NtrC family response regulator/two-component system response regulator HydG
LFLDEIGEMSLTAQAKLLRVMEHHVVEPLGGVRGTKVDIRVIAATNQELPELIKRERFRLDLYYRINVYQLRIPALRERPEDIKPILDLFLDTARRERGSRIQGIAPEALSLLQGYPWPGNVRELHNVVEWITISCKSGEIGPEHLPATIKSSATGTADEPIDQRSLLSFGLSVEELEKAMLQEALQKTGGNVSEASRLLKVTRNTLRYRMAKYNLK